MKENLTQTHIIRVNNSMILISLLDTRRTTIMNTFLANLKKNTLCLLEAVYVYLLFLTMETRMTLEHISRAK